MNGDIREWIRKNPKRNRQKLCKRFEDDNRFAYEFVQQYSEYQDFIKNFITDSEWAFNWAHDIGNKEFMKQKITVSQHAMFWAHQIGNKEFMKQIIEQNDDLFWIDQWNRKFEDNQI